MKKSESSHPVIQSSSHLSFSIVIPNYNGAQFLESCLSSLIKSLSLTKINYEIIIIDNNSIDDSLNVINNIVGAHCVRPTLQLIKNSTNFGFAPAVNQGIRIAKYNYVVLCNNDLTVDKNYFSLLVEAIKNYPDYTTFVGTVLNKEGTHFESQGLKFYYSGKCDNILNGQIVRADRCVRPPYQIWGASAALVTYQKDIITKIGMFDENFFAYEEDVDLAFRLHKFGYKTLLIPQALCYHLGGGTSGKMGNFRHKMDFKNWIFLIIKNYSTKEILLNLFPIIEQRLRNFSGLLKNTPKGQKISSISWVFGELKKNIPKMVKYSHDYRN